jgi:hypothetical protein
MSVRQHPTFAAVLDRGDHDPSAGRARVARFD